jgi:hypothetical protein
MRGTLIPLKFPFASGLTSWTLEAARPLEQVRADDDTTQRIAALTHVFEDQLGGVNAVTCEVGLALCDLEQGCDRSVSDCEAHRVRLRTRQSLLGNGLGGGKRSESFGKANA